MSGFRPAIVHRPCQRARAPMNERVDTAVIGLHLCLLTPLHSINTRSEGLVSLMSISEGQRYLLNRLSPGSQETHDVTESFQN